MPYCFKCKTNEGPFLYIGPDKRVCLGCFNADSKMVAKPEPKEIRYAWTMNWGGPQKKERYKTAWLDAFGHCAYCGLEWQQCYRVARRQWTIEHVRPASRGGPGCESFENWVVVCRQCNSARGVLPIEKFRGHLDEHHAGMWVEKAGVALLDDESPPYVMYTPAAIEALKLHFYGPVAAVARVE